MEGAIANVRTAHNEAEDFNSLSNFLKPQSLRGHLCPHEKTLNQSEWMEMAPSFCSRAKIFLACSCGRGFCLKISSLERDWIIFEE
ncbi:unnamed protein product [Citrullus colocynthis]|uniref:Uncharacterized protein n=1 Tax=Citrullus colocynthis TaxID=252529 RepID=A0ABP0YJZ6_9ROSI